MALRVVLVAAALLVGLLARGAEAKCGTLLRGMKWEGCDPSHALRSASLASSCASSLRP